MTQNTTLANFNGWESIPWKAFSEMIRQALQRQQISFSTFDSLIECTFQDMRTHLKFDELSQLYEVHQHRDFHLLELEQSKAFYEQLKTTLVQKYHQPQYVYDNKATDTTTVQWFLPFTQIKLIYDYQYKVIDELGVGAYRIDLHFSPQE